MLRDTDSLCESEQQLQAQLQHARIGGAEDVSDVGVVHRRVRVAEIRPVEEVERFKAELYGKSLGGTKILERGEVDVTISGTAQNVSARIPNRARLIGRKGSRVKPLPHRVDSNRSCGIAHLVGMVLIDAA